MKDRRTVRWRDVAGGALAIIAIAVLIYVAMAAILLLTAAHGQPTPTPTFTPSPTSTIPTSTPLAECSTAACIEGATGQLNCPRGFLAGNQNHCERPNIIVVRDNRGGFTCLDESDPEIDPEHLIFCDADPDDGVRWVVRAADGSWETQLDKIEALIYLLLNGALVGQAHSLDFSSVFSLSINDGSGMITTGPEVSLLGQEITPEKASPNFLLTDTPRVMTGDSTAATTLQPANAMSLGPSPFLFGAGTGGALSLADGPDESSCTACHAVCTGGCAWSSPWCTCTIEANDRFGAFAVNEKPSVRGVFQGITIGTGWRIRPTWAKAGAACDVARASGAQLTWYARGDVTIRGQIDMRGLGGCGATGGSVLTTANAGKAGQSTGYTGGFAGNNTGTAGSSGFGVANLTWWPGSDRCLLYGGGGGASPVFSPTQVQAANVTANPHYRCPWGAGGGGGGGCAASASGTVNAGGNGGGGLEIVAAGNITLTGDAIIDTRGADGLGVGGAGGGGGSARFIHGGTFTGGGATFLATGGAGSAAVHANCGTNAAGGRGQHIACSMRTAVCTCLEGPSDCAGY